MNAKRITVGLTEQAHEILKELSEKENRNLSNSLTVIVERYFKIQQENESLKEEIEKIKKNLFGSMKEIEQNTNILLELENTKFANKSPILFISREKEEQEVVEKAKNYVREQRNKKINLYYQGDR